MKILCGYMLKGGKGILKGALAEDAQLRIPFSLFTLDKHLLVDFKDVERVDLLADMDKAPPPRRGVKATIRASKKTIDRDVKKDVTERLKAYGIKVGL